MVAKAFTFILGLFVPIIVVFTLYRATLDSGPFSFRYVFTVISNEFLSTTDFFSVMVNDFSDNMQELITAVTDFWNPDYYQKLGFNEDSFWVEIYAFFVKVFVLPMRMLEFAIYVLFDLVGLVVVFISDFLSLLKVLGKFVFGVSPYPVDKYYGVTAGLAAQRMLALPLVAL